MSLRALNHFIRSFIDSGSSVTNCHTLKTGPDSYCKRCGAYESSEQIFFQCPRSLDALRHLKEAAEEAGIRNRPWTARRLNINSSPVLTMNLYAIFMETLWTIRNKERHVEEYQFSKHLILFKTKTVIKAVWTRAKNTCQRLYTKGINTTNTEAKHAIQERITQTTTQLNQHWGHQTLYNLPPLNCYLL
ncbi:hypothetical protein SAMD00019534_100580 [Acytostelium subglobosum LB1]|uniref:hypothetical protein n=1 Tax=Acytostelium subglobosum LB1 TaxID=1410327 RepID=UPI00064486D6|nr:hypothetical protein SAMD00019534_100580 [Acytostelium subglobosum LB1]GAM26883.1 hypothetical protein SAMD00019534_100580 [Acytostelium subglobosum LB1]|eukprot:XP_012750151.1 hypothetical protein SAMD00019534_100580 [Acytostelium subglobosum LB1]